MLSTAKILKGYKLESLDGEIGRVKEFYFDDQSWTIRYLVADTGNWLSQRQVLISPYALNEIRNERQSIVTGLTKDQITNSPPLDSHEPVSRQFEDNFYGYYGWPNYWDGDHTGHDTRMLGSQQKWNESNHGLKPWDPNLRSSREVTGYHIHAADGEFGHIEDFVIDDETWAIRYLIVDTQNWWPGNRVLISPQWIERVSWTESKVFINLPRETIKKAPRYSEVSLLNRDYENELYEHYHRPIYWADEPLVK